jgi:hypothetical protein
VWRTAVLLDGAVPVTRRLADLMYDHQVKFFLACFLLYVIL